MADDFVLLHPRWHGFFTNIPLQRSLELVRQGRDPLNVKQIIAISVNHIPFLQPDVTVIKINDRLLMHHDTYFIVMTSDQFNGFEELHGAANQEWWDYRRGRTAKETEGQDLVAPREPGSRHSIKVKNFVLKGPLRERHRYYIDEATWVQTTGEPLPQPPITILQYKMYPNVKSREARLVLLEAEDDPPIPHGMTMAMPLRRKGPAPQVVPGQGPQHGVPVQDGQPHQNLGLQTLDLEATLVSLMGSTTVTAERTLKLEEKVSSLCTMSLRLMDMFRDFAENGGQVVDAALPLKNYGNTMRADGMIENYITTSKQGGGDNVRGGEALSLKGKSVSQMDTPDIFADLVTALSRSLSSLKKPNANEQDPTGSYNTSADEYESALSYNPYTILAEDRVAMLGKTSKSSLVNKDVSSKDARVTDRTALERKLKIITEGVELLKVAQTRDKMETDRTALERKLQIISESVQSLKERLPVAKTGDEMETVTALEEQMTLYNNALFLKEKTGKVVGEVLPSKKKPEETVRTDRMVNNISSSKGGDDNMRENGLSHKGNSDSALDITYLLDEVVSALARTFVFLKITSVNGAECRGGYTTSTDESEYESISNPHMIAVKERVAMLDRRRSGKSPIKSRVKGKGTSSKAVMIGESSRECEDDLKTAAQGVMFLKEHLLAVKASNSEENGEGGVMFKAGASRGSSSSLMKAGEA